MRPSFELKSFAVIVVATLLSTGAFADVVFSDIPGKYGRVIGHFPFCTLNLELFESSTSAPRTDAHSRIVATLSGSKILFDGTAPCTNSTTIYRRLHRKWDFFGIGITSSVRFEDILQCSPLPFAFSLTRVEKNVSVPVGAFENPMTYKKGMTYVEFTGQNSTQGVCVYRKLAAGEEAQPPNRTETPTPKRRLFDKEGNTSLLWAWLGPCIGGIVAFLAALVILYGVRRNRQPDPADFRSLEPPDLLTIAADAPKTFTGNDVHS